jgi:hypothetical protein
LSTSCSDIFLSAISAAKSDIYHPTVMSGPVEVVGPIVTSLLSLGGRANLLF